MLESQIQNHDQSQCEIKHDIGSGMTSFTPDLWQYSEEHQVTLHYFNADTPTATATIARRKPLAI